VDDLMQEVLLAGWVALPAFNGRSRFKAWLFGIAMHKCADFHRAAGRDRIDGSIELQDCMFAGSTESLDDWSASIDRKAAIKRALEGLPSTQREVLEMYYYAELSLPEISVVLGRNLNTVKYQFYRAHTQAAETLGGVPGLAASDRLREGVAYE
jgi:RNA polymerase sigma-70 factor, ECF subfamily